MKELPEKIYLHLKEDAQSNIEATWSEDRIDDSDEEYVASRVAPMLSEVASEEIRQLKEELAKYKSAVEDLRERLRSAEDYISNQI